MITIHQGSILDAKADYIVNPANSFLKHGGGLARVIADAATQRFVPFPLDRFTTDLEGSPVALMRAARDKHDTAIQQWRDDHKSAPLIATGNAHLTSAGVLPFRGVIHAVGPIWNGGAFMERDLLEIVHEHVFEIAKCTGAESIAVPAISSGIFGFPINAVAEIAINVAEWFPALEIQFWLFSDEHREAFERMVPHASS